MKASYNPTDRANMMTVNGDMGEQPAVAVIAAELLTDGSPVASQFKAVDSCLQTMTAQITGASARFTANARTEELRAVTARTMPKSFLDAANASIAEAASIDAQNGVLMDYRAGDPALYPFTITKFAAMSNAEKATFLQRANVEQTSALKAAGQGAFDLDGNLDSMLNNRHMLHAQIRISGLQAEYQRKPSFAEPLAHGPDTEVVERAAKQGLQRLEQRRAVVAAANASLRSIVAAIALATDLSHDAAYALLTGRGA